MRANGAKGAFDGLYCLFLSEGQIAWDAAETVVWSCLSQDLFKRIKHAFWNCALEFPRPLWPVSSCWRSQPQHYIAHLCVTICQTTQSLVVSLASRNSFTSHSPVPLFSYQGTMLLFIRSSFTRTVKASEHWAQESTKPKQEACHSWSFCRVNPFFSSMFQQDINIKIQDWKHKVTWFRDTTFSREHMMLLRCAVGRLQKNPCQSFREGWGTSNMFTKSSAPASGTTNTQHVLSKLRGKHQLFMFLSLGAMTGGYSALLCI